MKVLAGGAVGATGLGAWAHYNGVVKGQQEQEQKAREDAEHQEAARKAREEEQKRKALAEREVAQRRQEEVQRRAGEEQKRKALAEKQEREAAAVKDLERLEGQFGMKSDHQFDICQKAGREICTNDAAVQVAFTYWVPVADKLNSLERQLAGNKKELARIAALRGHMDSHVGDIFFGIEEAVNKAVEDGSMTGATFIQKILPRIDEGAHSFANFLKKDSLACRYTGCVDGTCMYHLIERLKGKRREISQKLIREQHELSEKARKKFVDEQKAREDAERQEAARREVSKDIANALKETDLVSRDVTAENFKAKKEVLLTCRERLLALQSGAQGVGDFAAAFQKLNNTANILAQRSL